MPARQSKATLKKLEADLPIGVLYELVEKGSAVELGMDAWLAPLLDYYKINRSDPNKWLLLSAHLTLGLVPFAIEVKRPKKGGRPHQWSIEELADLANEIDALRAKHPARKASVSEAAKRIKSKKYVGLTSKTLENRYAEARKRSARLAVALLSAEGSAPAREVRPKKNALPKTKNDQKPSQSSESPDTMMFGLAELGRVAAAPGK